MSSPSWQVFVPCRLWTLNEEIRQHWSWRQRVRREVRATATVHARLVTSPPPSCPVVVVFTPQALKLNQDAGGCVTVAKPALDGLVDAGVLPDDGPTVVVAVTFLVAQRALSPRDEGLVITLLPAAT